MYEENNFKGRLGDIVRGALRSLLERIDERLSYDPVFTK